MAQIVGPNDVRSWSLKVDEEGWREYLVEFQVKCAPYEEGPLAALREVNANFPVGEQWAFPGDDVDVWATRQPETTVNIDQERKGDPAEFYSVVCVYSNRPPKRNKCAGDETGNPLCEPDRVSGRFIKYVEEATVADEVDYYTGGILVKTISAPAPIRNSAHEQIRGPQVEFDKNRQRIVVEQNKLNLELDLLASLIDTVNDASLWGFPNGTVKLSDVSWVKKYYGRPTAAGYAGYTGTGTGTDSCPDFSGCQAYYIRTLEFDIDYNGWERTLLDEGTKVLIGDYYDANSNEYTLRTVDGAPPDPDNPSHFIDAQDKNGNLIRIVLNGAGLPEGAAVDGGPAEPAGKIEVWKYPRENFGLLGLPASL